MSATALSATPMESRPERSAMRNHAGRSERLDCPQAARIRFAHHEPDAAAVSLAGAIVARRNRRTCTSLRPFRERQTERALLRQASRPEAQ